MWTTVSVYIALVLIAFVLYYLTKNTSKTGGTQNFWGWIKRGATRGGVGASTLPRRQTDVTTDDDELDVVTVLEDIYREFREESQRIRDDVAQKVLEIHRKYDEALTGLQDEISGLRSELQQREFTVLSNYVMNTPAEAPMNVQIEHMQGEDSRGEPMEATYFRILDELQQGKRPDEIASALGVGLEEVARVIQFMSAP